MRKGKLVKKMNYSKNCIEYERLSTGKGIWVETSAYLNAHDMKTFVGKVEGSDSNLNWQSNRLHAIKFGFATIEEAFEWAENQFDYKTGKRQ